MNFDQSSLQSLIACISIVSHQNRPQLCPGSCDENVKDQSGQDVVFNSRNIAAKKLIDDLSLSIASSLASGDEAMSKKLLADVDLEWNSEGWIERSSDLPFNLASIAFTIPRPVDGEHTYSSRSVNNSTSLVIDLSGVRTPEEVSDTGVGELYLSQENNEMFISLIKQLRENAEIKVFTDLL